MLAGVSSLMNPTPPARSLWQRLAVPRKALQDDLARLFGDLPADAPVVVHTDLVRLGIPDGIENVEARCGAWLQLLREAAAGRPLLVPTFNYDYSRTRRYDPACDPCQVGAFGQYCVKAHAALRTRTPVFSFCIFDDDGLGPGPDTDPFGAASLFAGLHERDALIAFLGVGMGVNTFVHFLEERLAVGYRYPKPMPGEVVGFGPVAFGLRVRPLVPHAVEYADLGEGDLEAAGRLRRERVGLGTALAFRACDYVRIVGGALAKDELHLLTPRSRAVTEALYRSHGRPLRLETMEG